MYHVLETLKATETNLLRSATSFLDGCGGQGHISADLPPEKTRCPFYRKQNGLRTSLGGYGEYLLHPPEWFSL
jgi:hypothetical protein